MEKGVAGLLALVISLVLAVGTVLLYEHGSRGTEKQETQAAFQLALGGVGMGAITVPAWNFGDFDPRIQPGGYDRIYPIPGGYSYSPDRLTMVSSFRDN